MLVQYLVGLCCLRWDPDAIDVTIGDMVYDAAAAKERDVDVTVSISEGGAPSYAFKAYEVKRENPPLDVADVDLPLSRERPRAISLSKTTTRSSSSVSVSLGAS